MAVPPSVGHQHALVTPRSLSERGRAAVASLPGARHWGGSGQGAVLWERLLTPPGPELPREALPHRVCVPRGEQGLGDVAAGPSRLSCCFPAGLCPLSRGVQGEAEWPPPEH